LVRDGIASQTAINFRDGWIFELGPTIDDFLLSLRCDAMCGRLQYEMCVRCGRQLREASDERPFALVADNGMVCYSCFGADTSSFVNKYLDVMLKEPPKRETDEIGIFATAGTEF